MASSSDESEDDFVVLGTPVPEVVEGQPQKKPITVQDLTARDKQGRRRFHGAFTGGFSAGYFNTVGTKEGFTPSTFVSSRSKKNEREGSRPEDFMDEEDLEEHGIAPRKFAATSNFTSEERKRKQREDAQQLNASSSVNFGSILSEIVIPQQLPVGIKLLHKMGWREGQGLGPRIKKKKKRKKAAPSSSAPSGKVYGCALPPSDKEESDSDDFVPEEMASVTFAPQDKTPISLEPKDNVHGLGYRGLDPSLALPGSHTKLFDAPAVSLRVGGKGIKGKAFGVGAFEDEDEDIYAVDSMSNYDITMQIDEEEDNKFGWTAPRDHGKQAVPVSYVGKLLEGFSLSSKPLKPKKKFSPPTLPRHFKPQHWFRKRRGSDQGEENSGKLTAVERGLMLGEAPIMNSVFDLVPKADKNRIDATKEAIAMSKSLVSKEITEASGALTQTKTHTETSVMLTPETKEVLDSSSMRNSFLSKFKPAEVAAVEPSEGEQSKVAGAMGKAPLFQGRLNFQPFRKDPAKQERYDKYLALVKQGITDPYHTVASSHMTEWEKSRERDEFTKAAKIYRPMSAMMSTRFVTGAMIDDDKVETPLDSEMDASDQAKAADMKMFGKLTREEFEWHPDKLLCRRFNVPNPYPGSDIVGLPSVKRDKFSVFNFLDFGDYQPKEAEEPIKVKETQESEPPTRTLKPNRPKRTMASVFKVLDDPDFHKPPVNRKEETEATDVVEAEVKKENENKDDDSDTPPDVDLFRAIFKNSDSEDSDSDKEEKVSSEEKESDENDNSREDKNDTMGNSITGMEIEDDGPAQQMSGSDDIPSRNFSDIPPPKEEKSFLTDPLSSQEKSAPAFNSTAVRLKRSRWGEKSVFSVLDDLDRDESNPTRQQSKVEQEVLVSSSDDTVSRLSRPDNIEKDEEVYGPRLPSPSTHVPDSCQVSAVSSIPSSKKKTSWTDKQKDRHKDRHKHKKEKKKKSKHKKDKKHKKHKKSSKSRKSKKEESNSGSEADTESDSEDSDVLNSALLERLKQVSGSAKSLQALKRL